MLMYLTCIFNDSDVCKYYNIELQYNDQTEKHAKSTKHNIIIILLLSKAAIIIIMDKN